nr:MAG TPA: hypothetical protein [Microviridae sp.]
MIKQRIDRTIWLATTLAIGVAAAILLECCTASMSLFWKNQNSSQKTQQSTTTRVDTLKTPDININL